MASRTESHPASEGPAPNTLTELPAQEMKDTRSDLLRVCEVLGKSFPFPVGNAREKVCDLRFGKSAQGCESRVRSRPAGDTGICSPSGGAAATSNHHTDAARSRDPNDAPYLAAQCTHEQQHQLRRVAPARLRGQYAADEREAKATAKSRQVLEYSRGEGCSARATSEGVG